MNVSLSAFRAMVGEYNLGNVVLEKDGGKLRKVNHHASLVGRKFNADPGKSGSVAVNFATRQALLNALTADAVTLYGRTDAVMQFLEEARCKLLAGENAMMALDREGTLSGLLDLYDSTRIGWTPIQDRLKADLVRGGFVDLSWKKIEDRDIEPVREMTAFGKDVHDTALRLVKMYRPNGGERPSALLTERVAFLAGISVR